MWLLDKTLNAGAEFGEIALITNQKRTATLICLEETYTLSMNKSSFDKILSNQYKNKII